MKSVKKDMAIVKTGYEPPAVKWREVGGGNQTKSIYERYERIPNATDRISQ